MAPEIFIAQRGRPLGSPFSQWIQFRVLTFLAAHLLKLVTYTLRVRYEGREAVDALVEADQRFILAFWHRRLVMMPLGYPFRRPRVEGEPRGVAVLTSDSKDGERAADTWRWFGIHAVRGSASHTGAQALVKMIQVVKQGWDLGITLDGPRGPRQQVKPGVLAIARKTGAWVVPVCVGYARAWALPSWDAMLVPKPFSRVVVRYGTPFQIATAAEEQAQREPLERILNDLEAWADGVADA